MIGLDISSWIQALAAVVLVLLTGATLWVLKRYADDTKTIALASVRQIENSQMPFLTIAWVEPAPSNKAYGWSIANQGAGPALSVRFRIYSDESLDKWRSIADISKGEVRTTFHGEIKHHIQNDVLANMRPFRIEYSSLEGVRYRTTVERLKDGELKTTFEKISK